MIKRLIFVATCLAPAIAIAGPTLIIVAPAAPGGGWDQTARVMQRVLMETEPGLSVQVDNVPGAAGAIGLARFVQSERGNPHALLVTGLVMVSGVIISQSPVALGDATPIARLTGEFEVIVVPATSPYRSLGDLVTAFRQDPRRVAWGGGSAGGTDDLLVRLIAEQVGVAPSQITYIAFSGGGAALGAVLGGQVTAGVGGYGEFAGQIEAGQLRVLAVSSPERVAGIDAATLREGGVALDLANWRGVMAPPGLSEAERIALVHRVTALAQSALWRQALMQNGWEDLFLAGQDFRQFLLSEQARVEAVLRRLASTDTTRASVSFAVAPTTLPGLVASLLAGVAIAFVARNYKSRRSAMMVSVRGFAPIAFTLLVLPLLFPAAGFVASSTLLFAVTAHALRDASEGARPPRIMRDVALGFLFSAALFIAFGRGLGVLLPPMPGLRGWL